MIKTSSWWQPLPADHMRIGISRGTPRFGVPAGYRIYRKLAPGPWFNSVPAEEFIARYYGEVLDQLDPRRVAAELRQLAGDRIPVLCCFERVNSLAIMTP